MVKFRKITLLSVFLLSCIVHRVQAQSYYVEDQRTFYGGLVAGGTFSQVDGDNFAGYTKIGATLGGKVYAQLKNKLAASIEILYTQKGSKSNKTQLSNNRAYRINQYDINLNYAEVPIMLNYFDRRKSHFGAGISYSQLISYKESVVTTPAFPDSIDLDDYPFRKFDLNFVLSGSLHLYKGIFLTYRFQYSVIPVRTDIYQEFGRAEQYNNMHVLRLMYIF